MMNEIINTAIENLQRTAGIKAYTKPDNVLDGQIIFTLNSNTFKFIIKAIKELRQHNVHQIITFKQQFENLIVIAENIFPKVKAQLRENNIPYIETNGNIFIKNNRVFLLIDTNKKIKVQKETTNRAFTKTGLKVIFHLLANADLINRSQREIAKTTGVALGNIPQIITGLKKTGFLIPLNRNTYVWEKRSELLNRWIDGYATVLRPTLVKSRYKIRDDWHNIKLHKGVSAWGGEPAADILTNNLRPEKLILYTKEEKTELIGSYRIIPDINGELEVLDMFWNNTTGDTIAHPILIYAELMITGGKRNIETAQIIYEKYIKEKL